MNKYSYVQLYYTILYVKVNTLLQKYAFPKNRKAYSKIWILILFSHDTVFPYIGTEVFAGFALSFPLKLYGIFVLIKLQITVALFVILIIDIIPAIITQICHQLSIPSSSFLSFFITFTLERSRRIIGIIKGGIPLREVSEDIAWRIYAKN